MLVPAAVHLAARVIFWPETHRPSCPWVGIALAHQALAGVADVVVVTGLPQLPRTYPAAAATIQHQGHPRRAPGWRPGAGAWAGAQLGTHLAQEAEEEEGQEVGGRGASHAPVPHRASLEL